jgi:hypothetical protein
VFFSLNVIWDLNFTFILNVFNILHKRLVFMLENVCYIMQGTLIDKEDFEQLTNLLCNKGK